MSWILLVLLPVRRLTSFSNSTDDMLLVQLGSAPTTFTDEQKTRWNTELREVLKQLRSNGIKDLAVVIKEVTEFRRRFLVDPTKVLNL